MSYINISESDYKLAAILKALGNPVRLSIVKTLIEKSMCPDNCYPCTCEHECDGKNCKCGCKCGELVDLFPISQSTISQHIKELKNVGLIETKGRKGDYTLNRKKLQEGIVSLLSAIGFDRTDFISGENSKNNACHCCS